MIDLMREVLDKYVTKYRSEFMDLRVFRRLSFSVVIQDGKADRVLSGELWGACARALINGAWGFSAINGTSREDLERILSEASRMAKASSKRLAERGAIVKIKPVIDEVELPVKIKPEDIAIEEKVNELLEIEKDMRKYDPRIVNTVLSYNDSVDEEIIVNSIGTEVRQKITRTRISGFVVTKEAEILQRSSEVEAGTQGYEVVKRFIKENLHLKACDRAIKLLSAEKPPAGKFTVVLDPSVVGLLVHEAFGHNSEADHVLSGESILSDKLGKEVASPLVTIVDDSTIEGAYGSYKYDSEGTPGKRRVIVDKGILRGFLHSLETAAKLNMEPNGSARANTHLWRPIVRMSNTYITPGDWKFEEMIEDVKEGIYCKASRWGYVFTEKGQFTCNVDESYMIRNGEIKEMLRNVSFGGLTLETLKKVDAVGRDFVLADKGICGKGGQGMFVGGGGPHIRIKEVVVGGRR